MDRNRPAASPEGLTRMAIAAADARDFGTLMSVFDARSVWDMAPWGLGTYRGPGAIARFFSDWFGGFSRSEMEAEEIVPMDGGIVYARTAHRGWPTGGRGYLQLGHGGVYEWQEEIAVRVTLYRDPALALEIALAAAAATPVGIRA